MRRAVGFLLVVVIGLLGGARETAAQAVTGSMAATPEEPYVGGRGLITAELATGMFLNPTSGTLRQYAFTLQYCAWIVHVDHETRVSHGAIAAFGLTDWLEIGAAGMLVDLPGTDNNPKDGGPMLRVRLLKDQAWWPELSFGGVFLFGDKDAGNDKKTVYVAASKGFKLSDMGPVRSARLHAGFRQAFIEGADDKHVGYVGGELELPKYIFVVAEVSNRSGGNTHTPWAAGIQVRHPDGFGFTLAAIQPGFASTIGVYVGIGLSFH